MNYDNTYVSVFDLLDKPSKRKKYNTKSRPEKIPEKTRLEIRFAVHEAMQKMGGCSFNQMMFFYEILREPRNKAYPRKMMINRKARQIANQTGADFEEVRSELMHRMVVFGFMEYGL